MEPVVRARTLLGFRDSVSELGGDYRRVYAASQIGLRAEDRPESWISFRSVLSAYEIAAENTGCFHFGMHLAGRRDLSYLGPLLLIFKHSRDLKSGLETCARFLSIQNNGYTVSIRSNGYSALWEFSMGRPLRSVANQWMEESLLTSLKLVQIYLGESFRPASIRLRHERLAKPSDYKRFFGVNPQFSSDSDAIELDLASLGTRNTSRDDEMLQFLTEYLEARVYGNGADTITAVHNLLRDLIPTGNFSIDTVASQLGLHRRTLQRRLDKQGKNYLEVLDTCRSEMALDYLKTSSLPLVNLAHLLGYADQSAFNHAFQRWYGMSPRDWQINNVTSS